VTRRYEMPQRVLDLAIANHRPWWFPLRLYLLAFTRGYRLGYASGTSLPVGTPPPWTDAAGDTP
jgi:hypothetical protein